MTMFIGPSTSGEPLEIGVVVDDDGVRNHPRDASQSEVLEGVVDTMKSTRANKATAIEAWADEVDEDALVVVDRDALKAIAEYAERRERVDAALTEAVRTARRTGRSWSEIGTMLGVSKQAAQRKYSKLAS